MTNGKNKFNVGYSEIVFFETVLKNHRAVFSYERTRDIQFYIVRTGGLSSLKVVLVSEYRLGEAFAYSVIAEFTGIDAIVNNGKWNAIVLDQREFKANTNVEVFKLQHFLGALNNPLTGR